LNRNEAGIIYRTLFNKNNGENLADTGNELFKKMSLHTLLIHSSKEVIAINKEQLVAMKTFFTPRPKMSTGAGDNFNAGYCAGLLLELDPELAVVLANAFSGYYVRSGVSAEANDIIEFLQNN
jgi:sugar/nucleoside kinase (ribokinase family)